MLAVLEAFPAPGAAAQAVVLLPALVVALVPGLVPAVVGWGQAVAPAN